MISTPQSDETLDEILKTLHSKHYDTIDGADNCEVAVQEAKLALTAYIDGILKSVEVYLPVVGYEGKYEVSNLGNVRSIEGERRAGKILTPNTIRYARVTLSSGGKSVGYSVHRLVATSFLPNPDNKPTVNHIDGNKLNNHVGNLEWATHKEQQVHASINGLFNPVSGKDHPHGMKTHCINGHEYSPENTRIYTNTGGYKGRHCKICTSSASASQYKRKLKARGLPHLSAEEEK